MSGGADQSSTSPGPGQGRDAFLSLLASAGDRPLCIVTYRGFWWPFCRDYFRELHAKQRSDRGMEGMKVVALTSEPQERADLARQEWGIDGDDFEFMGEPNNDLAMYLRGEYLPDLEIVGPGSPLPNQYAGYNWNKKHPRLSSKKHYPRGCLQPGVLIVSRPKGGGDPAVLYRWTAVSGPINLGGASGRPKWEGILDTVRWQVEKMERGEGVVAARGEASWGATFRDAMTCLVTGPIHMYKYFSGEKKRKAKAKGQRSV